MGLVDKPYVLAVRDYAPAFKLRPELRPPQLHLPQSYVVIAQIVADAEGQDFAASLAAQGFNPISTPNPVLGYLNVELQIDGASVLALAGDSHVFAIEPKLVAEKFDERQGVIMAGSSRGRRAAVARATAAGEQGLPRRDPSPSWWT
jgi:hypothetical protein